jgi:hypothetical protein
MFVVGGGVDNAATLDDDSDRGVVCSVDGKSRARPTASGSVVSEVDAKLGHCSAASMMNGRSAANSAECGLAGRKSPPSMELEPAVID